MTKSRDVAAGHGSTSGAMPPVCQQESVANSIVARAKLNYPRRCLAAITGFAGDQQEGGQHGRDRTLRNGRPQNAIRGNLDLECELVRQQRRIGPSRTRRLQGSCACRQALYVLPHCWQGSSKHDRACRCTELRRHRQQAWSNGRGHCGSLRYAPSFYATNTTHTIRSRRSGGLHSFAEETLSRVARGDHHPLRANALGHARRAPGAAHGASSGAGVLWPLSRPRALEGRNVTPVFP